MNVGPRGLEDLTCGRPSFNIQQMQGVSIPQDWKISEVLGDIIMAEYIDEDNDGSILRDGIYIDVNVTSKMWRVARILKRGPHCSDRIVEDLLIMFPSDKGIPAITFDKKKIIFLNEERIFAIVEKR